MSHYLCLVQAVDGGAISALAKIMKSQDDEGLLATICRIVKELCTEVSLFKRLLQGTDSQPLGTAFASSSFRD